VPVEQALHNGAFVWAADAGVKGDVALGVALVTHGAKNQAITKGLWLR
jgi:hypothetical protein